VELTRPCTAHLTHAAGIAAHPAVCGVVGEQGLTAVARIQVAVLEAGRAETAAAAAELVLFAGVGTRAAVGLVGVGVGAGAAAAGQPTLAGEGARTQPIAHEAVGAVEAAP